MISHSILFVVSLLFYGFLLRLAYKDGSNGMPAEKWIGVVIIGAVLAVLGVAGWCLIESTIAIYKALI